MIWARAMAMARPRAPPPSAELVLPNATVSDARSIIDSVGAARIKKRPRDFEAAS